MKEFHSLCLSCGAVAHYLWKGEKICLSPYLCHLMWWCYLFLFIHPICLFSQGFGLTWFQSCGSISTSWDFLVWFVSAAGVWLSNSGRVCFCFVTVVEDRIFWCERFRSSVKSLDLILPSSPGECHGRLACYVSQGNGCSMWAVRLVPRLGLEYAGSGFIPTSGRTARQKRSLHFWSRKKNGSFSFLRGEHCIFSHICPWFSI